MAFATSSSRFLSLLLLLVVTFTLVTAAPAPSPAEADVDTEVSTDFMPPSEEALYTTCQTSRNPLSVAPTKDQLQSMYDYLSWYAGGKYNIASTETCNDCPDIVYNDVRLYINGCDRPHYCSVGAEALRTIMQRCEIQGRAWGYQTYYDFQRPVHQIFYVLVAKEGVVQRAPA